MANQPSLIPSAWAANNSTTETIPATTSESGKASWDQGFPVETSLPLSEGGIPPKYGDFNGVLNVLSQFCLFAQAGGQYAWNATLDYSVGSIVLGTDGSIYRAAQVSGPSTTAVNPVGDTSGKWERIVSQSDINALEQEISDAMDAAEDAASNASAAQSAVTTLDANVVKLSGNQTVGGTKTFTSEPIVYIANPNMAFKSSDLTQASDPNTNRYVYPIRFLDKNGVFLGYLEFLVGSRGNRRVGIATYKQDGTATYLRLGFDTDGTPYISWDDKTIINGSDNQTITGVLTLNNQLNTRSIIPNVSNSYTLGVSGTRWKEIWCNQSSINTSSDERIKQQIADIPDAVLDAWDDVNWIQFKYNDSVEEKGADAARLHNGLIAQRIDEAFKAHGLDASKYGLFLYDQWDAEPEQKDENGNVTIPAKETGDAYGLRYTEALCMEAAYQRRRADRAEARISALEQRLAEMEQAIASLAAPVGDETYEQFTEHEQGASDEN